MTTNTSDDEVESADVEAPPPSTTRSTSDEVHKRSQTPYSVEKKNHQEMARLIQENDIVMDPPCTYCQKKMEKNPKLNHQCMRDEDISMLCQLCVVQKNVCSANPYKGQRVQKRKREGWVKAEGEKRLLHSRGMRRQRMKPLSRTLRPRRKRRAQAQFKLTLQASKFPQLR